MKYLPPRYASGDGRPLDSCGAEEELTAPADYRMYRAAGRRYCEGGRQRHPGRNFVLPAYLCRKTSKAFVKPVAAVMKKIRRHLAG